MPNNVTEQEQKQGVFPFCSPAKPSIQAFRISPTLKFWFLFLSYVPALVLIGACDFKLPPPPPDVFHKFNTLRVGLGPMYVTAADLNLDKTIDLLVANSKDNSLSLFYGKGDGTFQASQSIPVPLEPSAIAVSDINRDGWPDILLNSRGTHSLVTLLGRGKNSFLPPRSFKTGPVPLFLIPADFDQDGNVDIAVTLTFDKVEIHLGAGDGSFHRGNTYLTGSRSLGGVSGDFNRDGIPDLALATSSSSASAVRIFDGRGDGTFERARRLAKGKRPLAIVNEDMNEDQVDDLVVASGQGDNLYLLYGKGDGTFDPEIAFAGGGGPISLGTGDFDQDGQPDVVVANSRSSSFSFINRGPEGQLRFPVRDYVTGGTPLSLTVADLNGDGLKDIAVVSNSEGTVDIFLARRVFKNPPRPPTPR